MSNILSYWTPRLDVCVLDNCLIDNSQDTLTQRKEKGGGGIVKGNLGWCSLVLRNINMNNTVKRKIILEASVVLEHRSSCAVKQPFSISRSMWQVLSLCHHCWAQLELSTNWKIMHCMKQRGNSTPWFQFNLVHENETNWVKPASTYAQGELDAFKLWGEKELSGNCRFQSDIRTHFLLWSSAFYATCHNDLNIAPLTPPHNNNNHQQKSSRGWGMVNIKVIFSEDTVVSLQNKHVFHIIIYYVTLQ